MTSASRPFFNSETAHLYVRPHADPLPNRVVLEFAMDPEGAEKASDLASKRFASQAPDIETALSCLEASQRFLQDQIAIFRSQILQLDRAGEAHLLEYPNPFLTPWSFCDRLAWVILKLVGVLSIVAVLNTLGGAVQASGVIPAFVERPWMAYLFVFGSGALVIAIDAGIGTTHARLRSLFFALSGILSVAALVWWLRELGPLFTISETPPENLIAIVLSGGGALTPSLIWSQVALESSAGLLSWLAASRIAAKHTVQGVSENPLRIRAAQELRALEKELAETASDLSRHREMKHQVEAARDEFIAAQVQRVLSAKASAEAAARDKNFQADVGEILAARLADAGSPIRSSTQDPIKLFKSSL